MVEMPEMGKMFQNRVFTRYVSFEKINKSEEHLNKILFLCVYVREIYDTICTREFSGFCAPNN